jgi:hypothetical protein
MILEGLPLFDRALDVIIKQPMGRKLRAEPRC